MSSKAFFNNFTCHSRKVTGVTNKNNYGFVPFKFPSKPCQYHAQYNGHATYKWYSDIINLNETV